MKPYLKKTLWLLSFNLVVLSFITVSCNSGGKKPKQTFVLDGVFNQKKDLPFDSTLIASFYITYPQLSKYRNEVMQVYREHNFTHIWFDKQGVVEFGYTLFSKVRDMEADGVSAAFPYENAVNNVFDNDRKTKLSDIDTELMLTNLYLFYTERVYEGLDPSASRSLGWHLPRKNVDFGDMIDSVLDDPDILEEDENLLYSQYYKLRDALKEYTELEKAGGWNKIDDITRAIKPGDTGRVVRQVRERLYVSGELKRNNNSNVYDDKLVEAVQKFQKYHGFNVNEKILPEHIRVMNVPVKERIEQIKVNMERCRWVPAKFEQASEYIMVNIPSFELVLVENGKIKLEMPVVVGTDLNETVIFSGKLSYIVFSPYWNIPASIVEKEIKPEMEKDRKYLKKHDMEWSGEQLRQKPGKNNSLGLVKFMFPNSHDIYLHDTPVKSHFKREDRAFSHGCIRVGKPKELAVALMEDDDAWNADKIEAAMNAGEESVYRLKKKIPVYIGYFTAEVDNDGQISFYKDVYNRDQRLAAMLN